MEANGVDGVAALGPFGTEGDRGCAPARRTLRKSKPAENRRSRRISLLLTEAEYGRVCDLVEHPASGGRSANSVIIDVLMREADEVVPPRRRRRRAKDDGGAIETGGDEEGEGMSKPENGPCQA